MSTAPAASSRLTPTQWLICVIASIGFAFDIYELLMLPLIARPALQELGGFTPDKVEFKTWVTLLFYVPAVAGGIFGLLGGYLTDRLGRRRVLTWSILLYAFAAFAAGYSTNLYMLLFFRCLVFVGVCVEFVAAVAWLAELFDDPKRREGVLGFTQAFSSFGGLLVAVANGLAVAWSQNLPYEVFSGLTLPALQLPAIRLPEFLSFLGEIQNPTAPWRYTLMSGLIPAIPLIIIRPFLPESPKWQQKRDSGKLRRPSIGELFSPQLKRTTIVTTIMFACSFAAAFGAIQQMPQIVPGLPEVKAEAAGKPIPAQRALEQAKASHATKVQEIGGLIGRFTLAALVLYIASRQRLIRLFLLPGIILMPIIFGWAAVTSLTYLHIGIFVAGFLTVAQFSFWGNYLPHVYPVHLRGTGESFAANIGGRLIGTCFFGITQWIAYFLPIDAPDPTKVAYAAAGVAFTVYVVNFIMSFYLPEPQAGDIEH
jgi:MFS family permease